MVREKEVPPSAPRPAGTLERMIGRPPRDWTVDDLVFVAKDRDVRVVSLLHVGGDGWLKTLDFVPRSTERLKEVIRAGERADGSNLFPGCGLPSGASDIVLRPRIDTAFLDPFSPLPTLALLCGHQGRDGLPLPVSPDTIVRRAFERLSTELGVELWALGEVEYFLGKRSTESDIYGQTERGYHATSPFVFGQDLRREALGILSELGVNLRYGHSEVGYIEAGETDDLIWEQHEIELNLSPLPVAADAIALTQWVLRNLAHRRGMRLSFEPIVRVGHAGSGLHFHLSPVVGGEHVGGWKEGDLTNAAKWVIAGLVQLGGALMAFGNRTEGSFIRLTQGKEAPNTVTWGEFDRNALIRLPYQARTAEGRTVSPPTIEFRLPDGSAHPHLLLAGVAQAAVFGAATEDLDAILHETATARARVEPAAAAPVPRTPAGVARELLLHRAALEAGGVFPPVMIDGLL